MEGKTNIEYRERRQKKKKKKTDVEILWQSVCGLVSSSAEPARKGLWKNK